MDAVIAYTLPAMQLVCHLVASGSSGINFTEPVSTTTQSPPQPTATSLPEGYMAYPDIGFAYKYYATDLSWAQARNVCAREGAQLGVIDSTEKGEYLGRQASFNWVQAGIIRVDNPWIDVNTGESLTSLPWKSGEPNAVPNRDCVQFDTTQGLRNFVCSDTEDFFCQIPIHSNSPITRN